jgi:hypothetical protein
LRKISLPSKIACYNQVQEMKTYSKEAIYLKVVIFLLVLIPFIAQLLALPLVNKIHPFVIGFPLFHFWLLLWMILTPICTWIIYLIQKSKGAFEE